MTAAAVRAWFAAKLDELRRHAGSPSLGDLAKITAKDGPLSPRELAKRVDMHPKPLSKSTIGDLLSTRTVKAPDPWTLKMYVLACVSWGAHHGSPVVEEVTKEALKELLAHWQQLRTHYEDLLAHEAAESRAAGSTSGVRIGLPPQVPAEQYQRRDVTVGPVGTTVLAGPGGVGKTEAAADFARRIWHDEGIRLAMWVSARSRDAVVAAYAEAAAQLRLADSSVPPRDAAGQLLAWLAEGAAPWVILLDDLRRPEDLEGLWPATGGNGRVVVTTRLRDLGPVPGGEPTLVPVDVFTPAESDAYLKARLAGVPHLADGAGPLADALGHLPLALAQAVAYQLDRGLTCGHYLDRFRDDGKALDDIAPETAGRPVAATWALAVELADELEPAGLARPVLHLASVLEPTGTPRCIFSTAAVLRHAGEVLGRDVGSTDIHDALGVLHRLHLVTVEAGLVRVHTLVQRASREAVRRPANGVVAWHGLIRTAADAVAEAGNLPWLDRGLQERMWRSARALIAHGGRILWEPDGHPVLYGLGDVLGHLGHLQSAMEYFVDLAGTAAEHLGPDHADTLLARSRHAQWLAESGRPGEAAAELEKVIADRTRALGRDGVENFIDWASLNSYRGRAGDTKAAVDGFARLVERRAREHGRDSRDTLKTRHNLALWRGEDGDKWGALREYTELVPLFVREYGPYHPRTIMTRSTRASWLAEVDRAAGMVELQRLLPVMARVLGPYDTSTLHARRNLAILHGVTGHVDRAIDDLTTLVAVYRDHVYPGHPDSLRARHDLGIWLQYTGRYRQAHALLTDLLADRSRLLGPGHHDTLVTARNLRDVEENLA